MRLSPADVRQQQFTTKMLRGLDPQEVEAFLDSVATDYEQALRECATLKEQLSTHEERSRGIADAERTLKDTLMTTQRLSEELKDNAKREADLLVREATLQGEKLLEDARIEEAKLRTEIQSLKRARRQLIEDLREIVQRYDRSLSADFGAGTDAEHRG